MNKFEDLSGVNTEAYANPYDALIDACEDERAIQARYDTHRNTRNGQQKTKLLARDFPGLILDSILLRLANPSVEPGFRDPRHCLVFWARPTVLIKSLIDTIQTELRTVAPNLWLMPIDRLHLTALEITHSLTAPEIKAIVGSMSSETITKMTDFTFTHRARLIKPIVSYDGAAVALSFLPAAGESLPTSSSAEHPDTGSERTTGDDKYTYHHLRRDLFNIATAGGLSVDSRYVVPSSHITMGRFLTQVDHDSKEKMETWLEKIEEINGWLKSEFWPREGVDRSKTEWLVGEEKGLEFRQGTLWYGGGDTIRLGKGF